MASFFVMDSEDTLCHVCGLKCRSSVFFGKGENGCSNCDHVVCNKCVSRHRFQNKHKICVKCEDIVFDNNDGNKHKLNDSQLQIYFQLIEMGFSQKLSIIASSKQSKIEPAIQFITKAQNNDKTKAFDAQTNEEKQIFNLSENEEDGKAENKEEEPKKLALEVYGMTCDEPSCGKRCDPEDIFICTNITCQDDQSIYCLECGQWKHRRKKHSFKREDPWIKSLEEFLTPDQAEFTNAKAKANVLVDVDAVNRFLWHHRWTLAVGAKSLSSGSVTAGSMIVNGHMTIAVACGLGHSVIAPGLVAGAVGGGIGAVVGTMLESGFIWYKYIKGQLSFKEAGELTAISLVSNGISAAGFFGVMAVGAVFGAPGGPVGIAVGVTIGAVVAAILLGLGSRYALNKYWFKKKFENKHEIEIKLQKQALKYFFNDEKYPIDDETKFNDKILRKKYHRFCLAVHPDKSNEGTENEEWLKLCAYYGVLVGIWERKHNEHSTIESVDDISEEQKALIVKNTIKCGIFQQENTSEP